LNNPLLQSLFEEEERVPLTVTELNEKVRDTLERQFSNVWVEAEIADFSEPSSGHWYFTLHDGKSRIRAACFKGTNWKIRFRPFDGLEIRVRGRLSVYPVRGEYQLLVESLEPVGDGALRVAFDQIKAKLKKEGLFDESHKRELPFLPKRVGVVTSPTGAAIFDIINVISRRTRTVDIVLIPAVVQGETAPESIANAILLANQFNEKAPTENRLDVLIVGRGGGSAEDLAAFNEERLARTVFASEIPVISAVGHETDISIVDYVADRRAPTPSAAAELVASHESDLSKKIGEYEARSNRAIRTSLFAARQQFRTAAESQVFRLFPEKINRLRNENLQMSRQLARGMVEKLKENQNRLWEMRHRLSPVKLSADLEVRRQNLLHLGQRNEAAIAKSQIARSDRLKRKVATLHALSPLDVLQRGYSIARTDEGRVVTDAKTVAKGELLNILLARGKLKTRVDEVIFDEDR